MLQHGHQCVWVCPSRLLISENGPNPLQGQCVHVQKGVQKARGALYLVTLCAPAVQCQQQQQGASSALTPTCDVHHLAVCYDVMSGCVGSWPVRS